MPWVAFWLGGDRVFHMVLRVRDRNSVGYGPFFFLGFDSSVVQHGSCCEQKRKRNYLHQMESEMTLDIGGREG